MPNQIETETTVARSDADKDAVNQLMKKHGLSEEVAKEYLRAASLDMTTEDIEHQIRTHYPDLADMLPLTLTLRRFAVELLKTRNRYAERN